MLEFMRPGKPRQNAFIEGFNRTYRTEILDFYLLRTLSEAWKITERWLMKTLLTSLCINQRGASQVNGFCEPIMMASSKCRARNCCCFNN